MIPPDMSGCLRQQLNGEFPHYPPAPCTISILQSPGEYPDFVRSVCTLLRSGAEFGWGPQRPGRALVVVPFEFKLEGGRA